MDDYGYLNARVKSMKGRLLGARQVEAMVGFDLKQLEDVLLSSAYKEEVAKALAEGREPGEAATGAALERGVNAALFADFRKVLKMASAEPRELMDILLDRWNILNLKSLVRGVAQGASRRQLAASLVATPAMERAVLDELAKAQGIQELVNLIVTLNLPYQREVARFFREAGEKPDLPLLEATLDRGYFQNALKKLAEGDSESHALVRAVLRLEIDLSNAVLALKAVAAPADRARLEPFFVRGGRIDRGLWIAMAQAPTLREALALLRDTPLAGAALEEKDASSLSTAERALKRIVVARGAAMSARDPLSIAGMVGYLYLKEAEATDLRLICRGKAAGLPAERVRKELLLA